MEIFAVLFYFFGSVSFIVYIVKAVSHGSDR